MSPLGGRGWSRNYAICHHWVGEAGVRAMQYFTSGWEGLELELCSMSPLGVRGWC